MTIRELIECEEKITVYRTTVHSNLERHRIDFVLSLIKRDLHQQNLIAGNYALDDEGNRLGD